MKEIFGAIKTLKADLKKRYDEHGQKLIAFQERLNQGGEELTAFDDLWAGSWGQANYNHYRNPRNQSQGIQVNTEYFYDWLRKKANIDVDSLSVEVTRNIDPLQHYQQELITELSVIRDHAEFINENELLKSLDNFQWGFDPEDYVKLRRPNQIPIYDMRILSRGIQVPPHIEAMAIVMSLTTKAGAAKVFYDTATRLLRQLEIKLRSDLHSDDTNYTGRAITEIFDNFHAFVTQLKNRHNNRQTIEITDEYDVQDVLHAILKLHFRDVREEEYTPSYAGSSTRMDFLLKEEGMVIEVKKTREKLTDREIGQQLILDIAYYKNHPNCRSLKCFVYDPENKVKNPRGLESDLNKLSDDQLSVEVFIRP